MKNNNNRGSLTLEMAFVAPLMVLLIVGSIALGIAFINKAAILDSSFVGAKSAAYYGGDNEQVRQDIFDELDTRLLASKSMVMVTVEYMTADGVTPYTAAQSAANPVVTSPVPALPGAQIKVTLDYTGSAFEIPFLTGIFKLHASSISRNTNQ